jgi:hypothetical protein
MSPLFPGIYQQERGRTAGVPRMFQRPLEEMTPFGNLSSPGQFFFDLMDQDAAAGLLEPFFTKPAYQDMFRTMVGWFRPGHQKIRKSIELFSTKKNGVITLQLDTKLLIQGSW